MQAKKVKYDVIGLAETRRWSWRPHQHEYGKNIDSFEQLTTRVGCLRMRRCGPTSALTIFVAYAPTSCYEEKEVEAFYMDLDKLLRRMPLCLTFIDLKKAFDSVEMEKRKPPRLEREIPQLSLTGISSPRSRLLGKFRNGQHRRGIRPARWTPPQLCEEG